jgi:hypothetical protein
MREQASKSLGEKRANLGPYLEALEPRWLMWATVEDGVLLITPATPQLSQSDITLPAETLTSFEGGVEAGVDGSDKFFVNMQWNGKGGTLVSISRTGIRGIRIEGSSGNDLLGVSDRYEKVGLPVTILGGAGDDILFGGSEDDVLIGGDGNDRGKGFAGSDTIEAERGISYDLSTDSPNAYFSRFLSGDASEDSAFANDPLESDPIDLLRGSPEWNTAIARATGMPLEQKSSGPAAAMPTAPLAPPAPFSTTAVGSILDEGNSKVWDYAN